MSLHDMSSMKRLIAPAVVLLLASALFTLPLQGVSLVGVWINRFFPCEEQLVSSLACFVTYDIYAMGVLALVAVASFIILIIRLVRGR